MRPSPTSWPPTITCWRTRSVCAWPSDTCALSSAICRRLCFNCSRTTLVNESTADIYSGQRCAMAAATSECMRDSRTCQNLRGQAPHRAHSANAVLRKTLLLCACRRLLRRDDLPATARGAMSLGIVIGLREGHGPRDTLWPRPPHSRDRVPTIVLPSCLHSHQPDTYI